MYDMLFAVMQPLSASSFSYPTLPLGAQLLVYTTPDCSGKGFGGIKEGDTTFCPNGNDPTTGNPTYTVGPTVYNDAIKSVNICGALV